MAKIRGRITQRLAGTRGVLLSMSGYSDEALEGIVRGQQLDMLLLDRTHLEAMLSGLLSPADLSGRRLFLAGDGHFGVVDLDKTSTVPIDDRLRSPHPDQRGAIRIDEHTVMTATRHGTVYRIDVETGETDLIARLAMLPLGCDMTSDDHGRAYILEHQGSPRALIPIVVTLSGYAG